ncbi:glycosyltransferase [Fulvivirga sp. RKSG066]|uniref:glycosyltransferase n=1 Tax=Fulvivirga aurantia TaxID=2529383 RepID=UPI0012BC62DC|nr:glycosyltransferase [Fulvivirga aurantia]MTI22746.1 glycosyltransferase [Fulvivirga aurantia]
MSVLLAILLAYCGFVMLLIYGWFSTSSPNIKGIEPKLFYSIIIPFRNEADNLKALIASLDRLNFPKENYEVILVNDHSTDTWQHVLKDIDRPNLKLINATEGEGKKAAINTGIDLAKGEVIVTTDADCKVPSSWLHIYSYYFEVKNLEMVFGAVAFAKPQSFFQKMQQVEFASLIGSGASTLRLGLPSMCNGANLAFTKKAFNQVGGYNDNLDQPSGDDEFLMHKIYRHYKGKVAFLKQDSAAVLTTAQHTWKDFYNQRKRWASKWKAYKSIKNSLLAATVFAFNVSIIWAYISLIVTPHELIIVFLFLKLLAEGIFLKSVMNTSGPKFSFPAFIFLQITYPFYVVLFGLTANFGHYNWKGRKHRL